LSTDNLPLYLKHNKFEWSQLRDEVIELFDKIFEQEIRSSKSLEWAKYSPCTLPWAINYLFQYMKEEKNKNRQLDGNALGKAIDDAIRSFNMDHPGKFDSAWQSSLKKRIYHNLKCHLANNKIKLT